jgi:uncharacterized protein YidB (DUF937 family)
MIMSKSTPSLLALLGLVAVAGYQNRGRISEMLSDAQQNTRAMGTNNSPIHEGFLAEIGNVFRSGLSGLGVSTALGDLQSHFKSMGWGDAAESWVSSDPNRPLDVTELEAALGPETLAELGQKTGLSRAELLLRLNAALPEVVNRLTPNGRLPLDGEDEGLV